MLTTRLFPLLLALAACTPVERERDSDIPINQDAASAPIPRVVLTWPAPAVAARGAAAAEGTLVVDEGCLYLASPERRSLLVFPEGTRWDYAAGGLRFGNRLLRADARATFSGNRFTSRAAVAPRFDPEGCDASDIFRVDP